MGRSGSSSGKRQVDRSGVVIALKSQDGITDHYRYQCDRSMKYLFKSYCKEKNLEYDACVFLYDSQIVKPTKTPLQIGLEDGDEIDVMLHQNGGGYSPHISIA